MEQETQALQFTDNVPVLILSVGRRNLILPNVNIAEFVHAEAPEEHPGGPPWFLGLIPWRGLRVSLIDFAVLNGDLEAAPEFTGQVAILNGITDREELPFFAVSCNGIPRQLRVMEEDIAADNLADRGRVELNPVKLAGEPCSIPDLEIIEAQVARVALNT